MDVLSCSQLGCISVWVGCGWRIGCSACSCVSRSSIASGTRHSRDVCAECVYSAVVCDDGVVFSEGYEMFSGDDAMYANECCVESVGDDR